MTKDELYKLRSIRIARILNLPDDGRRHSIRCPFHNERTPSCVIFPDNGFRCFGCGANGFGAIDFVMKMGFTFQQAVEELRPYLGQPKKSNPQN